MMEGMSDANPSPRQARAAVEQATIWPALIHRAERPLRSIPLVLAATYLAVATVAAIPFAQRGYAVLLLFIAGLAGCFVLGVKTRAISRIGRRRFHLAIGAFSLWNASVVAASVLSGWWAPGSPPWHLTVSAAVAVLPLLAASLWRSVQ